MDVWLNGRFVDAQTASVAVFDAGVQHGVGLFETMLARNGRVFRLDRHLGRLADSARELRLTTRLHVDPLQEAVQRTLDRNEMASARVRLTLTGGDLSRLQSHGRSVLDPTIFIVAQPPTAYPEEFFEQGVRVTVADGRLNPLDPMAGHKTLNYWARIQALQQAAAAKSSEALWFTVSNHLAGGSVSNVFLVRDGVLSTPIARGEEEPGALPSTVLPGITRSTILELAGLIDLAVERRMLDIDALLAAEEVFLTNSSWGVLPVTAVEKSRIGDGAVGPLTRRLRGAWQDLVDQETREMAV